MSCSGTLMISTADASFLSVHRHIKPRGQLFNKHARSNSNSVTADGEQGEERRERQRPGARRAKTARVHPEWNGGDIQ